MDVREKLIEILRKPIFPHELVDPTEAVADYLLDNGVTVQEDCKDCAEATQNCIVKLQEQISELRSVQEWISVKDRLPEVGGYVVCIAKRNPFSRFMPMVARIEKNGWVNPMTEQYISEVTHWMPMPELPKGGNMQ